MTPLRRRMIEDMQVRNLFEQTFQKQATKQTGEHLDRQEESNLAGNPLALKAFDEGKLEFFSSLESLRDRSVTMVTCW
jgi:hypothetical protein